MLRVIGINAETTGDVSIDAYVPLSFRAAPSVRPNPILWRIGDRQRNLFELKLDRSSGEVFGATLVLTDREISNGDECLCADVPVTPGLPLVDISGIAADVFDEPSMFRITRATDLIGVLFGPSRTPTSCLSLGRVRFLLDGEVLMGVCYGPLTQRELELIR